MLHASTQKLILKLCDLTERAEAPWKEAGGDTSAFETEGYRIEVQPEPPHLRIVGSSGKEVERADAAQLATAPAPGEPGKTFADKVQRLALDAHRIARGAETAISAIMSALSAPKEPPARFSTAGGPESEAAMAAAVADMATRLSQPLPKPAPAAAEAPRGVRVLGEAAPKRTGPTFGAIPSFAVSRPPAPTPAPVQAAAPAPPPAKVTSSGLVVTGFRATSIQTPETSRPRPSSAGYRPWT